MSNSQYTIRNYQPSDFNNYVLSHQVAEKLETVGRPASPEALAEHFRQPNYSPTQDLFIVETAGNIIGYMDMVPEHAIGRIILYSWVHPEHRRKGLARKLLGYAMLRAKELEAKVLHINISQDNEIAKRVLSRLGFERVRHHLELRLDMDKVRRQDIEQAALGCRHLQSGEEDKLTHIQNRSFAGTWGYNPNTIDKVIGFCWTQVTGERGAASDDRKGLIYMIGTDPDYRSKGLGKRVLLAGLAHLRNRGIRFTELTVDSENKVACALYRSVGFEVRTSSLWFEKVID